MADSSKIVFWQNANDSARLVFGAGAGTGAPAIPAVSIGMDTAIAGDGAGLPASIHLATLARLAVDCAIAGETGLPCDCRLDWQHNVSRPGARAMQGAHWQQGKARHSASRPAWQQSGVLHAGIPTRWQQARPLSQGVQTQWHSTQGLRAAVRGHWQQAQNLPAAAVRSPWQQPDTRRAGVAPRWQQAGPLRASTQTRWQEMRGIRAAARSHWQQAGPIRAAQFVHWAGGPSRVWLPIAPHWQYAARPDAGIGSKPDIAPNPPKPPCYDPDTLGLLVFGPPHTGSAKLRFICARAWRGPSATWVVPVKKVYVTINSTTLTRVDTGQEIPMTQASMRLDVDSWTWQFSATAPYSALPLVWPDSQGEPIVAHLAINGTPFALLLEKIDSQREFSSGQLRITGRGLAAQLDAPYAPVLHFSNSLQRNARQLLDDIFTINGVSIGWDIERFDLTDWPVPAHAFSHSGTYITAASAVVNAAGGYIQPHDTLPELSALLRYPAPFWEWEGLTPDIELPSAVVVQESIQWTDAPWYNRVWVSGQEGGILGRYTRAGTAGDILAPAITDPLITHADAARQRGRAALGMAGRSASIGLRLPVLQLTGIIRPGQMVRYVDTDAHIGIVRATSVDITGHVAYQSITLETHLPQPAP